MVDMEEVAAASSVSAFRLECLPQYLVPQEDEEFSAWRRGERTLATPDTNEWLQRISSSTRAGYRWYRVHVLDYPLTEYSQFELFGYQANSRAGEEIYIADRDWHPSLDVLRTDFWLFDGGTAVVMIYDDEGRFVRPELAGDARPYREMRDLALRHSVSLDDYLRTKEPRLTA